jgi:hypothetical protein
VLNQPTSHKDKKDINPYTKVLYFFIFFYKSSFKRLGVVVHACNPSYLEVGSGGSASRKPGKKLARPNLNQQAGHDVCACDPSYWEA